MLSTIDYDGIFFLPGDKTDEMVISKFDFTEDMANGRYEDKTELGEIYHVLLFQEKDGEIKFDETFEAIFGDPASYVDHLLGSGVYGCVVKKTNKSGKWLEDYLKTLKEDVILEEVVDAFFDKTYRK
tara:strand:+ start:1125 stop:1505 length:381 start_codon:yes stop_codon:yes gene_type:complete